jgi:HlyD family secretion protein
MDIPRQGAARKKLLRRIAYLLLVSAVVLLIALGTKRLKPAAPAVERSTIWTDTVKRGPMLRQVRGLGTLVPEEILWVPAPSDGRVERILAKPGALVGADTVLLVLRNPELEQAVLDAEYQLKAAEAQEKDLRIQLAKERLSQVANIAGLEGEYSVAKYKAERDDLRFKERLIMELDYRIVKAAAAQLAASLEVEKKRLDLLSQAAEAQVDSQKARLAQLRGMVALRRSQMEGLRVQSGATGVLQELPVEVGKRVSAGAILAKVAQPERLKAELKIAETQAKDIQLGQRCSIDTRNGVIEGRVARIDPSVKEGTVTVDVKLEGALPAGARPDLSVDGTVELERLDDVVFVGRPTSGQPKSTIALFRVNADGQTAARVQVKLGRGSVTTIEILEGLRPGDQVILSDMTTWDSYDRIRLQ